jgi:outer membrane lipase/esterase
MSMGIREHVGRWAAALCLVAAAQGAVAGPYSNLYVFGDSLSDTGNDLLVTGGAVPSPAYYTDGTTVGRFTNGRNYVDFLADGLGLSVSPSQLGGTNYAYGGARVNGQAAGLPPTALSFNQQVASYMATHAAGTDPNALYVVWIGANDVSDAIAAAVQAAAMAVNPADVPGIINGVLGAAIGSVMSSLGNALGGLAALGASHFLVPNLPDLSLTPRSALSATHSSVALPRLPASVSIRC